MRITKFLAFFSFLFSVYSFAEPINLEQADFFIQPGKVLEIGTGLSYGYAKYYYAAAPTVEYENKDTNIPVFFRFKFMDNLEISLKGTYRMLEETEFGINKKNIGYIDAAGKLKLFDGLAAVLQAGIPGENSSNSAVEGLNAGARLLATLKFSPVLLHLNGGYTYTFEYILNNMRVDPGNYLFAGASLEYEMNGINPLLEFTAVSFTRSVAGGVEDTNEPLLMDVLAGFSFRTDSIKIKAGFDYSLDKFNIYNWKLVSGISLLL